MTKTEYQSWRQALLNTEQSYLLSVGDQVDDLSRQTCFCCGEDRLGERHQLFWKDPIAPVSDEFHEDVCCTDCLLYLANGEEPDTEE